MTADGEDSQPTEVVPTGQAALGEPSPGHPERTAQSVRPEQPARPARSGSPTWWVLPYFAGALAVFVVAGLVIGLRSTSASTQSASSLSTVEIGRAHV